MKKRRNEIIKSINWRVNLCIPEFYEREKLIRALLTPLLAFESRDEPHAFMLKM